MSIVVTIVTGHTNTGRFPTAYAHLDCGHNALVVLRPEILECSICHWIGLETECKKDEKLHYHRCPSCTRSSFSYPHGLRNPHNDEDRLTKVGDEVGCAYCTQRKTALAKLKALDWSTIAHTRYRGTDHGGSIYVYKRDSRSPSGVRLEMTVEDCQEATEILSLHPGMRPLSPTEGMRGRY